MRNTTTQLDQAEQSIIERLQARLGDPTFSDPAYGLAIAHAIDLVRLECKIARGDL